MVRKNRRKSSKKDLVRKSSENFKAPKNLMMRRVWTILLRVFKTKRREKKKEKGNYAIVKSVGKAKEKTKTKGRRNRSKDFRITWY